MVKREIIAITVMLVVSFSIIISIPIIFISINTLAYRKIFYQNSIETIFNSTATIDLNFNIDVGDIGITYNYEQIDYHTKIEVIIEMVGQDLVKKNYADYFKIEYYTLNTSITLNITLIDGKWFDETRWLKKNIKIEVSLNPNLLFNINTVINKEGNVDVLVLGGLNINNVDVFINQGTILYDFFYCTVKGNVSGHSIRGDLKFIGNNVKYTNNSRLSLINDEGLIIFDVFQSTAMEVNLTGIGKTKTGQIKIKYFDYSQEIGAKFTFHNYSGIWQDFYNIWVGFPEEPESFYDLPDVGYKFTSIDFPAENNYILSLYRDFINRENPYIVNLSSVPFY